MVERRTQTDDGARNVAFTGRSERVGRFGTIDEQAVRDVSRPSNDQRIVHYTGAIRWTTTCRDICYGKKAFARLYTSVSFFYIDIFLFFSVDKLYRNDI